MEYKALTIAGFDGSGGAGIQADLKTFSALGCYGMSVLTALPIQNTIGVRKIYRLPLSCIEEQLISVLEDIEVDAIKIGMLDTPEIIKCIAKILTKWNIKNIVLDPVMFAKSGHNLLQDDAIDALKDILSLASIITPNIPEAETLLGYKILDHAGQEKAAKELLKFGCKSVLLKGGHLKQQSVTVDDFYVSFDAKQWLKGAYIDSPHTHGTGCTLSSAIAALLAQNVPMFQAVIIAKIYISRAIEYGSKFQIGKGKGPVHHFFHVWPSIRSRGIKV